MRRWTFLLVLGLVFLINVNPAFSKPKPQEDGEAVEEEEIIGEIEEGGGAAEGNTVVAEDPGKPGPDAVAPAAVPAGPSVPETQVEPPGAAGLPPPPAAVTAGAAAQTSSDAGELDQGPGPCGATCMLAHQTPLILFACILVSILLLLVILLGCYFMRKLHGRAILTANQVGFSLNSLNYSKISENQSEAVDIGNVLEKEANTLLEACSRQVNDDDEGIVIVCPSPTDKDEDKLGEKQKQQQEEIFEEELMQKAEVPEVESGFVRRKNNLESQSQPAQTQELGENSQIETEASKQEQLEQEEIEIEEAAAMKGTDEVESGISRVAAKAETVDESSEVMTQTRVTELHTTIHKQTINSINQEDSESEGTNRIEVEESLEPDISHSLSILNKQYPNLESPDLVQRVPPTSPLKPGEVIERQTKQVVVPAGRSNEQKIVTTTTTKVVSTGANTGGGGESA